MSVAIPDLDAAGLPSYGLLYRVASTGVYLPDDPRLLFDLTHSHVGATPPSRRRRRAQLALPWQEALRIKNSRPHPPSSFQNN